MKSSLVCISGVRGYEEDGVAYLHIEDSARGLGFEKTENKNGVEYNSIRWAIVEGYLRDFGFRQEGVENANPHDYYIPENIFYRLCMKAKNEVAEKFQANPLGWQARNRKMIMYGWLREKLIPSI